MMQYIESPEFQQLLADNPRILIGIAGWITFTLVTSLLCLSRWFSVTMIHHHHYAPLPPQGKPGGEILRPKNPQATHDPKSYNNPEVFNEWLKQNIPDAAIKNLEDEPILYPTRRSKMSTNKRFAILRRDGFRCRLCGLKATEDENLILHVDHRLPLAAGGTNDEDNLWTLCERCNLGKSDQVVAELLPENDNDF